MGLRKLGYAAYGSGGANWFNPATPASATLIGDFDDFYFGGSGNDTINSRDGVAETVDCGAGKDTVKADKKDRLKHCEKILRRSSGCHCSRTFSSARRFVLSFNRS